MCIKKDTLQEDFIPLSTGLDNDIKSTLEECTKQNISESIEIKIEQENNPLQSVLKSVEKPSTSTVITTPVLESTPSPTNATPTVDPSLPASNNLQNSSQEEDNTKRSTETDLIIRVFGVILRSRFIVADFYIQPTIFSIKSCRQCDHLSR